MRSQLQNWRTAFIASAAACAFTVAGSTTFAQLPPAPSAPPPPPGSVDYRDVRIAELNQAFEDLRAELLVVRQQLAQAELDRASALRELDELRQFIADHRQYGRDFEEYRAVRELAEREMRQRDAEAARERRELERTTREMRRTIAIHERAQRDMDAEYRRSGFSPIGLNVYTSRIAFFYETREVTPTRMRYEPGFGRYIRTYPPHNEINYSQMTITGSVINATGETRDLGVAITFFNEDGTQVGQQTIRINNARPTVPYPFTASVEMALDRPFASSSMYVLYADPVYEDERIVETAPPPEPSLMPVFDGETNNEPHRVPVYPPPAERP